MRIKIPAMRAMMGEICAIVRCIITSERLLSEGLVELFLIGIQLQLLLQLLCLADFYRFAFCHRSRGELGWNGKFRTNHEGRLRLEAIRYNQSLKRDPILAGNFA